MGQGIQVCRVAVRDPQKGIYSIVVSPPKGPFPKMNFAPKEIEEIAQEEQGPFFQFSPNTGLGPGLFLHNFLFICLSCV